jgi:hypothetical protein
MDFIVGLPRAQSYNSIWVIVDRLTKVVYVEDSLPVWSAEEDCVGQRNSVYFDVLGEVA